MIAHECSRTLRFASCSLMLVAFLMLVSPNQAVADNGQSGGSVQVMIEVESYQITSTEDGQQIMVPGFGRINEPGRPDLPAQIFAVAIPPGAEVSSISVEALETVVVPGTFDIRPVFPPRLVSVPEDNEIDAQSQALFEANYEATYSLDDSYPAALGEFIRSAGYRKYNLADVRVCPFTYYPQSGRLEYHPTMSITVEYAQNPSALPIIDHNTRTEQIADGLIVNYDEAQPWYGDDEQQPAGLYDFVIITLDSLTSSVQPIVDWEEYKGRTVNVVTTDWVNSNYSGYDLAEKMRNFLRDKYPTGEWGIEDVLLVGHYDDVPMRRCWQDVGYGKPETDFYYAELSLPDSQSWDDDGDHRWGEDGDQIDFYNEVNVGRIPWSNSSTVQHICEKSAAYENNSDPAFKKNILLLGAYFWSDTDNAVLMEYKVDEPWMSDWTMTRLYEQYSSYSHDYDLNNSNTRSVWSNGQYAFVNWAGHGSPTSCHIMYDGAPHFISTSDCSILNDDYPSIIFADACSNSDTDYTNIGQKMLEQGGVGFVGSTKVAFGMPGWSRPSHGSSQSMDYYFTTNVTSCNYTQGGGHQAALRTMYQSGLWYYTKYEMFEWGALWGNPDLGMDSVGMYLVVDPTPLFAGDPVTFKTYMATPFQTVYFTYSLVGEGSTYVPALNVTLDLNQPKLVGSDAADADGYAEYSTTVPPNAGTRLIWFQAAEYEGKTNVVATQING